MIQFEQKIGKSLVDFGGIKHVQKNCDKNLSAYVFSKNYSFTAKILGKKLYWLGWELNS